MSGRERRNLRLSDITARRIRGARVRRQEVVEPDSDGDVTSDDDSDAEGESDSDSDESDIEGDEEEEEEGAQPAQPGLPTPTSKTERVIPTLTAITHSPRPIPSKITATQLKNEDPAIRTTLSTSTYSAVYTPPAVEAGIEASPTENYPSATTGAKGLLESGPTQAADSDGSYAISVNNGKDGGLNAGEKAGMAVGVIAGVALLAALVFFLRKWFLSYLSRKENQEPSPPRSPNALNNTNPGVASPTISATINPRSNSQVLDELIAASYVHQNGGSLPPNAATMPPAFMYDEKLRPSRNADEADSQPQIRFSIASWLRRHHPLKLNPLSARGSLFSNASKSPTRRGSGDTDSPMTSQRNTMATNTTNSVYDYYSGSASQDDLVPPLPPAYYGGEKPQSKKTAQMSKYQSVWSESTTTSGGQDRMMSGVPESVVTESSSGNTSILWLYGRPVTNTTNTGSTGSVYLEPLPVSPLSPSEGGGRPFKRGSSPVLPPGY